MLNRFSSALSVLGVALGLSALTWVGLGLWQPPDLSVLRAVVPNLMAEPNGVATVVYRFEHAPPGRYDLAVTLPQGWRSVHAPDAVDVPARGGGVVFLNVRLPAQTQPGRYPVVLRTTGAQALSATSHVVVKPVVLPRLTADVQQLQVEPGSTVRLNYTLTNVGNRAGTFGFRVDAPQDWETDVLRQRVSLAPGQTVGVSVQATISAQTLMERKEVTLFAGADREVKALIKVYVNPVVP